MEVAQGTSAPVAPSAAPAVTEAAVEKAVETKQEEDPQFGRKFAALSRKEKQLLDREKQYKSMMADPAYKEYETFRQLKADPRRNAMKMIESMGVPLTDFYQDLTSLVLNDGKPSVEQELQSLRDQIESDKKYRTEQESRQEAQAEAEIIEQYQGQIISVAEKEPDAFELMNANADNGSFELALEVAKQHFAKTGEIIPPRKACEAVETYLEAKAKKMLHLKKLGYQEKPATETTSAPQKSPSALTSKTLTNQATAASVASPPTTKPGQNLMDPETRLKWSAEKLRQARLAQSNK